MKKRLIITPEGWPCSLAECRPGHFVFDDKYLGFKSEYLEKDGQIQAFNEGGEFFVGGKPDESERRRIIVQPVKPEWEEYDD